MITLGEIMTLARDAEAKKAGIGAADIELARKAGMLAADVAALKRFTAGGFCIVVRCPKPDSYAWQGLLPAKIGAVVKKTGDSGVVSIHKVQRDGTGAPLFRDGEPLVKGSLYVSDYDLMGVWQGAAHGWRRIRISAQEGAKRGSYGAEAAGLLRQLNSTLVTRIQHGCQDDWLSPDNRGVKNDDDTFAGFISGEAEFLATVEACRNFYSSRGLGSFPYHPKTGAFTGA
ncbi:hypothetical protein [Roseococcus sp. YIM B11640]|uniref:hypothetical protein n=1 Tax=Roseococcus sp. YIM B11640 TaxID=3133973 RepID=UPI003C7E872C